MNPFSALRTAPAPAVVLGFGGLVPFVGLALLVAFVAVMPAWDDVSNWYRLRKT